MRSRLLWLLAAGLLVAVGVVLGVVLTSDSEDLDARGTADAYLASWHAGDAKRLCELRTEQERSKMVNCDDEPSDQWVEDMSQMDFTIDIIEVAEDAATVSFTQQDGYSTPKFILETEGTMDLHRIGGAWQVGEIEYVGDPKPTLKTDA